jgi:hypothetical protein
MGRFIEFECEVKPDDVDKRQTLTTLVDIGMITAGFRVRAGSYRIRIEKVDPPKKAKNRESGKEPPPT